MNQYASVKNVSENNGSKAWTLSIDVSNDNYKLEIPENQYTGVVDFLNNERKMCADVKADNMYITIWREPKNRYRFVCKDRDGHMMNFKMDFQEMLKIIDFINKQGGSTISLEKQKSKRNRTALESIIFYSGDEEGVI